MSFLITGSEGFLSQNFFFFLKTQTRKKIYLYNKKKSKKDLEKYILKSKFIFHFAGENRNENKNLFKKNNEDLTEFICDIIKKNNLNCKLIFSSSIHYKKKNIYGKSKKNSEKIILKYLKNTNAKPVIYRLPNLYGKWSKPNYNSVVATFSYNIFRKKKNVIKDNNKKINLLFIDDAIKQIYQSVFSNNLIYPILKNVNQITPYELNKTLLCMYKYRNYTFIKNIKIDFLKKLYSVFLTYAPKHKITYNLINKKDKRGEFLEFIKLSQYGQISYFDINPGSVRGNHYHNLKTEKFLIISGIAKFNFFNISNKEKFSLTVSAKDKKVVETIPGYVHSIKNIGKKKTQGIIWANEEYNSQQPDTYTHFINEKI